MSSPTPPESGSGGGPWPEHPQQGYAGQNPYPQSYPAPTYMPVGGWNQGPVPTPQPGQPFQQPGQAYPQPQYPYGAPQPVPYQPRVFDTSMEPIRPGWVTAALVLSALATILLFVLAALPLFFDEEDIWILTAIALGFAVPSGIVTAFLWIRPGQGSQITSSVYWALWAFTGALPAAAIPLLLLVPRESRDYFDHWQAIRREYKENGLN